jgi:rhomboid protease GluP
MTPQLLVLIAASLVALQIVSLILRREHVADAPYLGLLVADLALLVWAHVTHRQESLGAFVGAGIAGMLTIVPRVLDSLERAALGRDDFRRAARVAMVRELITPGRSAAWRRRQLEDLAQTRSAGSAEVVRRLRAEVEQIGDPERALRLREELATVLFFDQRFVEGIAETERHLDPLKIELRPAFVAYLVRAYGEVGRLDRAARMMALLEEGPAAHDPSLSGILAQARLTFLAFVGRPAHVEALLGSPPGSLLPARAQAFLLEVARTREGTELDPAVAALADEVFKRASLPTPIRRRKSPVTYALIIANLIVFAVLAFIPPGDEGTLVRAGALFRPAVLGGEPWRLGTGMFLHAGVLHLAVNMYGLYLLGRFTEDVFGSVRFLAVYLFAGLAGAVASTLVGAGALSVGASGAIMGLLGALIVTLVLRRGHWPETWRRALLGNLVLLGALQIYIGFEVSIIDNAAHVGGMLGGAMATLLFAPGGLVGAGRRGRVIAVVAAATLSLLTVVAFVLVTLTPLDRTLERAGVRTVDVNGVALTVPGYWEVDRKKGRVEDPYLDIEVTPRLKDDAGERVQLESPQANDPRYRPLLERIGASAHPVIMRPGPPTKEGQERERQP